MAQKDELLLCIEIDGKRLSWPKIARSPELDDVAVNDYQVGIKTDAWLEERHVPLENWKYTAHQLCTSAKLTLSADGTIYSVESVSGILKTVKTLPLYVEGGVDPARKVVDPFQNILY